MKLGIIGLGLRMSHMLNNGIRPYAEDLEVVGLVDPDRERALASLSEKERASVQFFQTAEEMVEATRPDALAIGTRCNLHSRFACEVADYGIPLLLEKPVATTMEQALALEQAFAQATAEVVVSFPLRASDLFREISGLLASSTIGRPEHILGVNYVPYGNVYFDSWYRDYRTTQGLFLQKATHDFDYLAALAGAPITRVAATTSQGRVFRDTSTRNEDEAAYFEGIGNPESGMNEDSSNALLEFANGVKGVYTQVFFSKGDAAARGATISGYKGTLSFDWYKNQIRHVPHFEGESRTWSGPAGADHFGGDSVLARNFVDVVRGDETSISPIETGLHSVYACLAARESAATGQFVNVRQIASAPAREVKTPAIAC